MVMTDPIADMLTRIRNGNVARLERIDMPSSRVKEAIARILKQEGFIRDFERTNDDKQGVLSVRLKLSADRSVRVITGLKRISRPGLRVYARKEQVPKVLGGLGVAIVSTSQGIVTDREARKLGLGGEVLCYIW